MYLIFMFVQINNCIVVCDVNIQYTCSTSPIKTVIPINSNNQNKQTKQKCVRLKRLKHTYG